MSGGEAALVAEDASAAEASKAALVRAEAMSAVALGEQADGEGAVGGGEASAERLRSTEAQPSVNTILHLLFSLYSF